MTSGGSGYNSGANTILFGGSGFLGSYILKICPAMVSVGRTHPGTANRHIPITSLADLDVLRGVEFDSVVFIIGHSDHHTLENQLLVPGQPTAFDYHVTPVFQVLEQLKQYPIRKLLHFSTVLLYDWKHLKMPVSETAPVDPYSTRYVLSKHMAEDACRFFSRWIPIINVRLANMYGPSRARRYDIIHQLITQLLTDRAGSVSTTRPRRDFIHVEDAARAVSQLLSTDFSGTINLGTGTMTAVSEIVDLLRELSGCPIHDRHAEVSGPEEFQCDIGRLRTLIDWMPRYSTAEGVRQTWGVMSQYARD